MLEKWNREDIKQIALLESECFSDAWSENMLISSFETDGFLGYTYKDGDKVIGYIGISYCYETADVLLIAVEKNNRRRGIATELLNKTFSDLKALNVERVLLEVRESNLGAKKCYKKAGFKEIAVREGYYQGNENAIIMEKEL